MMLVAGLSSAPAHAVDCVQYVNPFIGTVVGSGNTYPGPQVPFGMISWSPQSEDFGWDPAGYSYKNEKINGFGLIHLSGAGCSATCELPFMPCTGDLNASPATHRNAYNSVFSHANETAEPGYYAVKLSTWGIAFENTTTARAGIAHIDFPATAQASVLLNPGADGTGIKDGAIEIDPTNRAISGWARSGTFCGIPGSEYQVYFAAQFDRPFQAWGTWKQDQKSPASTSVSGPGLASYLTFDCRATQRVTMKVAVSFVSIANAKLNLDTEIPGWDFAAVRTAASDEWNRCLNRIQIKGGSREDQVIFYTALYHTLMLPSVFEDVNGQYIGMDNRVHTVAPEHHFLATFSGWDTYRTQAQLWGLLYPEIAGDFCSSLLAMSRETQYKGGGGLPLWSLYNDETLVMAGYPADPFIASAYAFGATNFDLPALKAVMVDSARNQRWCGRNLNVTWDCLPEYERYGYCPADVMDYSCSKNVEFSVADFAIAQICAKTGDQDNYAYFLKRSQNVFNLINPEQGWLQRRNRDGKWVLPFDRFSGDGFMEGNAAQYTWTIPHSLNKLIGLLGGKEKVEARLDEFTSQTATGYDYQSKHYDAGNEPCFGIMPVYNWLGKPWKAQERMRTVMLDCFHNRPAGIPGDDDSGAMSAWYVFAALGMYPEIPGVGGVTVLSPLFPKAVLRLRNGKTITIVAEGASRDAKYVQSLKANGRPSSKLWMNIDDLKRGARLDFVMGASPNTNWGVARADAPPSFEPGPDVNSWSLSSPDERCEIRLSLDNGCLSYQVAREGKVVLSKSPLGLARDDQSFESGLTLLEAGKVSNRHEKYELFAGVQPRVDDVLKHRRLLFRNAGGAGIGIELAAGNQGVAFRYFFAETNEAVRVVQSEATGFTLPANARGWLQPYHAAGPYTPAYEDFFFSVSPGDPPPESRAKPKGWAFPALFQVPNAGAWVLLTESGTDGSYCGCHLGADSSGGLYRIAFPLPDETTKGYTNRFGPEPRYTLPWTMPWRVIILGESAKEIALETLVTDLAPPSRVGDTSWIKPGRASWAWWSYSDERASAKRFNEFSDFGARMGWEYTLFDAGWWGPGLKPIADHAAAKGVVPLAWSFASDFYDAKRRAAKLDEMASAGVRGVKVDFWCSDRQEAIAAQLALMEEAAGRGMVVNLHGCTIPRGAQRTWPNFLTCEAVLGCESYFYESRYTEKAAELDTVLPFTRNAIGPMDLTPVACSPKKFARLTTAAHQLASALIFTSGIIHYADKPEFFESLPPAALQIFRDAPARWDETRCLAGEPGREVVFARRSGQSWFIAGINGTTNLLQVKLDLSAFKQFSHRIAVSEGTDPNMSVSVSPMDTSAEWRHEMPPRGGFILRLSKQDIP
jgi:predicted alpha-1,2-mannosidase